MHLAEVDFEGVQIPRDVPMDIYDRQKRSQLMAGIRTRNTRPEITVRKVLFSLGYRYRLNDRKLPGKPDIVLPRYKSAIFVHGCFWHHHSGCKKSQYPITNSEFWKKKITSNVERDQKNIEQLEKLGWTVLVVWECESKQEQLRQRLQTFLSR